MMNRLAFVLLIMFLASACATKDAVQPDEGMQPAADQKAADIKLPDIDQKKEAPEVKKPQEKPKADKKDEQFVMLNFENADIETVVATVADMLKINYILAPGVTGKITIQSHNKIPLSELFPTLQTALEFNGFTAVKDGSFYRIVQIDNAKQQPIQVQTGKNIILPKDASFVTQEIPLEFVKASDVANLMRNLMPRGTDIVVYEPANMLVVTAAPAGMLKLLKLLEVIDIPASERETIRTFVYPVENGEAKKLAEILKNVYAKKNTGAPSPSAPRTVQTPQQPQQPPQPRTPIASTRTAAAATTVTSSGGGGEGLAGELEGELLIEAYDDINSLVIKATPRGYVTLLETIKKLDIQPKQVLIEVLIAEISLDDKTSLGLEWLFRTKAFNNDISLVGGFAQNPGNFFEPVKDPTTGEIIGNTMNFINQTPGDTFVNLINPNNYSILVTALAQTNKVNVLASPHILAIDNKEAKIEIGSEVPVATSITSGTVDATNPANTTSQVQFKSVGTLLTVTPHINDKKQVSLKISQEVSEIGTSVKIGGQEFTGFNTRKANTSAIVQDGHTLVIGGIISQSSGTVRTGLPFLSDIPLLGYLFGATTDRTIKRELIVLITPHVVSDKDEADALTEEFKSRVRDVKKKIEKRQAKLKEAVEDAKEEKREREKEEQEKKKQ